MKSKKQSLSLMEAAHEMAKGLYSVGAFGPETMRYFDEACLPPAKKLSSTEIKKLRLKEKISQAVFAKYLNTSVSTIRQWEQGTKQPRGTSLKLLNLVAQKGLSILI